MTRLSITIRGAADRDRIAELAKTLPVGMRVDVKQERRSSDQNAKLWASLQDIAEQVEWHGVKLTSEDWKLVFMDALKREVRIVPNLDGNGFVNLGRSSSDLSKEEFSDLLELLLMFGANHNVTFHDPNSSDASPQANPSDRMDAPAGNDAPSPIPAGAYNSEEVSVLPPDWRDTYLAQMTGPTTRAMSIQSRDHNALQMIGPGVSAAEREWMRQVATLANKRDKGKLRTGEFEAELKKLKTMRLSSLEMGQA